MIILGIDPGYHTGIAVVDWFGKQPKALMLNTVRGGFDAVRDALTDAESVGAPVRSVVVQTPIFRGKTPRWNKSPISIAKNAQLAGRLAGYLEGIGLSVQMVHPQRNTGMKMDAAYFNRLFQWTGRSSEHARDAANLTRQWKPELVEAK